MRELQVLAIGAALGLILTGCMSGPGSDSKSVQTAAHWPQWQGPGRDNLSADTGLLKKWPEEGPRLLWRTDGIGLRGFSAVSVADGSIYTAGASKETKREYVSALNMDGKRIWKKDIGAAYLKSHGGSRATPTVVGSLLYHMGGLGKLLCMDTKTGDIKWSVDIVKQYGGKSAFWGFTESVLVDGDKVFFTPGGKNVVVALDRLTGKETWITKGFTSWAAMCSPIIVEHAGIRQVITLTAKYAISVDPGTGKLFWRYRHKTQGGAHVNTPIFHKGSIYGSTGYGAGGFRLDLGAKDGQSVYTEKWKDKTLDNHHGGVVLVDGFIYGTSYKGKWVCLDFEMGKPRYVVKGVGKGTLTYADGMLYCLGEKGTLALVKPTPKQYEEVSRFKLPSGGDRQYWARPVVTGGRLYIRHANSVFAYDVRERP